VKVLALTPDDARRRLVHRLGLDGSWGLQGEDGTVELLDRLRMIQLDPLDPMGTNADLVAMARVDGLNRGDVHRFLGGGRSFEHFAKMRCLLPAETFPQYRDKAGLVLWWRTEDRLARLPEGLVDEVEAEVAERGPIALSKLRDRGTVKALSYGAWKGTGRANTMALEVLWGACRVVVVGRAGRRERIYDVPARSLAEFAHAPAREWGPWALTDRVRAAGLLPMRSGPWWGAIGNSRTDGTVDRSVDEGAAVRVRVGDGPRVYLADPRLLDGDPPEPDDRVRILGPLDPLIWDRDSVRTIFDFEYLWEVYKPVAKRRWGWYVCPLLQSGRLVGRIDAKVVRDSDALVVRRVWWEDGATPDRGGLEATIEAHAQACGVRDVVGL
jgi:uncharacterized protein YcaQ